MSPPDGTDQDSIIARLRSLLPSLSTTAARIGRVILADPSAVVRLTVTDVAAESGSSVGSVVRFCQDDLGLRGFQDLKLRLAADARPARTPPAGADSPASALASVLHAGAAALTEATRAIPAARFARAAEIVGGAAHLLLVGVGTSAPLAHDAAYRFRGMGIHAEHAADVHMQHVMARHAGPGTAVIAVSHTGQTRETLATVRTARDSGAPCVAITSFARSPLTELSEVALIAGSAETQHQVEAMTSRIIHLAVLDALRVAVTAARPEATAEAQLRTADVLTDHRI